MAFLDNIGKKVTEAGQKVRQVTGEISDTSRLNAQISEEERRISAAYQQIGKLYMNLHHGDPEPAMQELVQSVIRSEQTIHTCRQQIQRIRRVRTCARCGAEISADHAFCPQCGTPVQREAPTSDPRVNVCAACGTVMALGMRFCTNCGRPLGEAPADPEPEPVSDAESEPAPQSEPAEPDTAVLPADMPEGFSAPEMDQTPAEETPDFPAAADPEPAAPDETPAEETRDLPASTEPEPTAPDEAPAPREDPAPMEEASLPLFCPNCGAPREPEDAFCMNCGVKL